MQKFRFPRLLPLISGLCFFLLLIKMSDYLSGSKTASLDFVTSLQAAQTEKSEHKTEHNEGKDEKGGKEKEEHEEVKEGDNKEDKKEEDSAKSQKKTYPSKSKKPEFTRAEIEILQRLTKRREAIELKEKKLLEKENVLKLTEQNLDKKIGELKELRAEVQDLLNQYRAEEDKKIRSLVQIYSNMKPKDAAEIFNQLETSILLEVIDRMKERKVAPILSQMDTEKAKEITVEFAKQKKLPYQEEDLRAKGD